LIHFYKRPGTKQGSKISPEMTERQVILTDQEALLGADLELSFKAVRAAKAPAGLIPRFKKKEEIGRMSKSILKHKIQSLTGKNIKQLEEGLGYKPKDPNEPSMDIDTMRRLASSLVLQAAGELPDYPGGAAQAVPAAPAASRKRSAPAAAEAGSSKKSSRKSLGVTGLAQTNGAPTVNGSGRKLSRRSIAAIPSSEEVKTSARTPVRTPASRSRKSDLSSVSEVSQSVTTCLGPEKSDSLAALREEGEEVDQSLANPTPMMKEMMKKRKSLAPAKNSPIKVAVAATSSKTPAKTKARREPSPPPREDFPCNDKAKVYLLHGDPLDLKYTKMISTLPLSAGLPGFQLTMVHTPAEWAPPEIFLLGRQIKSLNREAGLENFVIIVGTGLSNAHMNMEALERHTKHVQFVTFHREDGSQGEETGKLRETTSHFIAAYFFPGCETAGSVLPSKMVRDGYTTNFRCDNTAHLESSIIDCFTEAGEWILDLCPGKRKLVIAAGEKGRSAVALNSGSEDLEDIGNFLRTLALKSDKTYRDKDGIVLVM